MKKQLYQAPDAETIPILVQGYICQSIETDEVDLNKSEFFNDEQDWNS